MQISGPVPTRAMQIRQAGGSERRHDACERSVRSGTASHAPYRYRYDGPGRMRSNRRRPIAVPSDHSPSRPIAGNGLAVFGRDGAAAGGAGSTGGCGACGSGSAAMGSGAAGATTGSFLAAAVTAILPWSSVCANALLAPHPANAHVKTAAPTTLRVYRMLMRTSLSFSSMGVQGNVPWNSSAAHARSRESLHRPPIRPRNIVRRR